MKKDYETEKAAKQKINQKSNVVIINNMWCFFRL